MQKKKKNCSSRRKFLELVQIQMSIESPPIGELHNSQEMFTHITQSADNEEPLFKPP